VRKRLVKIEIEWEQKKREKKDGCREIEIERHIDERGSKKEEIKKWEKYLNNRNAQKMKL